MRQKILGIIVTLALFSGCLKPEQPVDPRISAEKVKATAAQNFGPAMIVLQQEIGNLNQYPAVAEFRKSAYGQLESFKFWWKLVDSFSAAKGVRQSVAPQAGIDMLKKIMETPLFKELFSEANVADRGEQSISYHIKDGICTHLADAADKDKQQKTKESCQKILEKMAFKITFSQSGSDLQIMLHFSENRDDKYVMLTSLKIASNEFKASISFSDAYKLSMALAQAAGESTAELEKVEKIRGEMSFAVGFGEKAACLNNERFCVSVIVDKTLEISVPSMKLQAKLQASTANEPFFYGSPQQNNDVMAKVNFKQIEVSYKEFTGYADKLAFDGHFPAGNNSSSAIGFLRNISLGVDNWVKQGNTRLSLQLNNGAAPWEYISFSPQNANSVNVSPGKLSANIEAIVKLSSGEHLAKIQATLNLSAFQDKNPVLRLGTEPTLSGVPLSTVPAVVANRDLSWVMKMPQIMAMPVVVSSRVLAANDKNATPTLWLDQGSAQIELAYEMSDDQKHQGRNSLDMPTGHCLRIK